MLEFFNNLAFPIFVAKRDVNDDKRKIEGLAIELLCFPSSASGTKTLEYRAEGTTTCNFKFFSNHPRK